MDISLNVFSDSQSHILLNPHWTADIQKRVTGAIDLASPKNHFWIGSSGTENFRPGHIKMVALSKDAVLAAAKSVCATVDISAKDVYYNVLPIYHVGGLSTLARAHVSGCEYISAAANYKWNAREAVALWNQENVTITSLVPTQIFDVVQEKLAAPQTLRFVFVGGGALSDELWRSAKALGWNLLPTYGMTEASAMIAYSTTGNGYELFPHIEQCRTDSSGHLQLRSASLLSHYLFIAPDGAIHLEDPKEDGWFTSGDRVDVRERTLFLKGRESELVKIKGESVSLLELTVSFENFCLHNNIHQRFAILALPDARDGHMLLLVTEGTLVPEVLEQFNQTQLPFARLNRNVSVAKIPLSPLGKVDLPATRALVM